MNFKEHCRLCKNQKTSLQDGIICGLTKKKPAFEKTCSNIKLSNKLEKDLGLVHIEIEKLKKKKILTWTSSLVYLMSGCFIILMARNLFFSDFVNSWYIKLTSSLLVAVIGFSLFNMAYGKLRLFTKKIKIAKSEKERINTVLDKYQIEYSCNVKFGKKYHENQDVIVEIVSNSSLLKNSKITYQI